jgi:uncharacterized membrane-anchored protein
MKLKLLILILALQTAWILTTAFTQERALAGGTVITLETVPVDPRDLLRGDYVILNYKISTVPMQLFSPSPGQQLPIGESVYVLVEKHGDFYEVVRASEAPLDASPGEVMLKGQVERTWDTKQVRLQYGLERYYVPEGTGNLKGKLTVQAAVPASGQARIKQVLVDGKPYAESIKRSQ